MSSKSKLPKHQITDFSKVNTSISDSITYYDSPKNKLLNLITINKPKPSKDTDIDKVLRFIMNKMHKKSKKSASKTSSKLTPY
jgi:predicted membrane-bound dolichyl-phosphate-mannose-protein mannosyltransferase